MSPVGFSKLKTAAFRPLMSSMASEVERVWLPGRKERLCLSHSQAVGHQTEIE